MTFFATVCMVIGLSFALMNFFGPKPDKMTPAYHITGTLMMLFTPVLLAVLGFWVVFG